MTYEKRNTNKKDNKKPTCTEKKENKKYFKFIWITTCKFKECTLSYAKVKCNEYNKRN